MRAQGFVLGGAVYLAIACGSACGGDQTTPSWGDDGGTTSSSGGSSGSSGASNGTSGSGSGSTNGNGSGSGSGFGSSSGTPSGSGTSNGGSGGSPGNSSSGATGSSSGSTTGSSSGGPSSSSSGSGSGSGTSSGSTGGGANPPDCSSATNLNWQTGNETVFESYPPPGSAECIQYSGCMYQGQFGACGKTVSQAWVQSHNIFSVYPNLSKYQYHWICLKDPGTGMTIAGLALDTCADSDCGGCCTQNLGSASLLIDVEINTDARFTNLGINGGQSVQWADYGPADPSAYAGCN